MVGSGLEKSANSNPEPDLHIRSPLARRVIGAPPKIPTLLAVEPFCHWNCAIRTNGRRRVFHIRASRVVLAPEELSLSGALEQLAFAQLASLRLRGVFNGKESPVRSKRHDRAGKPTVRRLREPIDERRIGSRGMENVGAFLSSRERYVKKSAFFGVRITLPAFPVRQHGKYRIVFENAREREFRGLVDEIHDYVIGLESFGLMDRHVDDIEMRPSNTHGIRIPVARFAVRMWEEGIERLATVFRFRVSRKIKHGYAPSSVPIPDRDVGKRP